MTSPAIVKHRINTISALQDLNERYGCEIDLRSNPLQKGHIFLAHDSWTTGDHFSDWLKVYAEKKMQGPLILNTKEDLLEERALELIGEHGIKNYFFLDTTVPTLVRHTSTGNKSFAVRYSQFEPMEFALKFARRAAWVWVDCFKGTPPPATEVKQLKEHFKVCLVSPELHGVATFDNDFLLLKPLVDAICTKNEELWR